MQGAVGRNSVWIAFCAVALLIPAYAQAQVFVIQPEHVSQRYAQFQPTQVRLPAEPLTTIGREQLIRVLQSEEGFAMRPLPVGILTLRANGGMEPSGDKYIEELHNKGIAAKPGQRVQITEIKFHGDRMILDIDNGPYNKHRFMRHVSIGLGDAETNPTGIYDAPPSGTRIVLVFPSRIPDLNGEQMEQLLKPMIDFGVRSPAEAYAETLPDFLRKAIVEHRVLVGMDRDMVLYAKGEPDRKDREQQNGKPFEIWMYGQAPDPVEFVRFDGDFVVRVEMAKVGEPVQVHADNQMQGYWGTQPPATAPNVHTVQLGDRTAQDTAAENAPPASPTLRQPGEKLPNDNSGTQVMKPVKFPPGMQQPGDPGYTPPASASPSGTQPASATQQAANGQKPGTQQNAKTQQGNATATQPSASSPAQSGSASNQEPRFAHVPPPVPATTPPPTSTPQQFVSSPVAQPSR